MLSKNRMVAGKTDITRLPVEAIVNPGFRIQNSGFRSQKAREEGAGHRSHEDADPFQRWLLTS